MKRLNNISYIDKRKNYVNLNGEWEFDYYDNDKSELKELKYKATLPASVFYCVEEAGILPSPYFSLNSKQYYWVDEKTWVFRKKFFVSNENNKGCAVLCFDGVGYYSDIYINGKHLGKHEGLFGGPYVDVHKYINYGEINELEVIIKAVNKENLNTKTYKKMKQYREIMPWGVNHCSWFGNLTGDFALFGIWKDVRIEFYPIEHIARPFISTLSINNSNAILRFECDFINERINEMDSWHNFKDGSLDFSIMHGFPFRSYNRGYKIVLSIIDNFDGREVEKLEFSVDENDRETCPFLNNKFPPIVVSKTFSINNVKLWKFEQGKDSVLYCANVCLYKETELIDEISFNFGIRTIEHDYTFAEKIFNPQDKHLYIINGEKKFIKGMNWCPDDILYRMDKNKIEWLLDCAKSAGIEFLRVWNGGNQFESDEFYDLCDRKGIMVWQDTLHANAYYSTLSWPVDVVESQVAVNVQRLRKHPSLAVWCGGNELNYYQKRILQNLALERNIVQEFDNTRHYFLTTPYGGSVHIYGDIEPTWLMSAYKEAQFVAESGVPGCANYKNFKKYFSQKTKLDSVVVKNGEMEFFDELTDKFSIADAGDIYTHLARIEFIATTEGLSLKDIMSLNNICATAFYKYLIEGMRGQFPKTGGVVPWTLNRDYMACAAYMCIDADGEPTAQYYAVKKAYSPTILSLRLKKTLYSVGEQIELPSLLISDEMDGKKLKATVIFISSSMQELYRETKIINVENYITNFDFSAFTCTESVRNSFISIIIRLEDGEKCIYDNLNWVKCTDKLLDDGFRQRYENELLHIHELADDIKYYDEIKKYKGSVICNQISCSKEKDGYEVVLAFKNISDYLIYPISIQENETPFVRCSDNYFALLPKEEKQISCIVKNVENINLNVSAWNLDEFTICVKV